MSLAEKVKVTGLAPERKLPLCSQDRVFTDFNFSTLQGIPWLVWSRAPNTQKAQANNVESASLKMFCSGVESLAQVRSAPDAVLVPSCERRERLGLAGVPRVKPAFPVLFGIKKEGAENAEER